MSGFARVLVNDEFVQVRFESIDSDTQGGFHALRDRFYQQFPHAQWNRAVRWMVLPRSELNRLVDFCAREFGVEGVQIEDQQRDRHIGFHPRF